MDLDTDPGMVMMGYPDLDQNPSPKFVQWKQFLCNVRVNVLVQVH